MNKNLSPIERMLNVWAIILIIWSVYRAKFHLPEWFDEFIAKPTVFILPVYYYIKKYEKTDFASAIWFNTKKIFTDFYIGIFIGIVFASSALLSNFFKKGYLSFGPMFLAEDSNKLPM